MSHDDPTQSHPLGRVPPRQLGQSIADFVRRAHETSGPSADGAVAAVALATLVAGLGAVPSDADVADVLAAESQIREAAGRPATFAAFAAEWPDIIKHPEACRAILMDEFAHLDATDLPKAAATIRAAFPSIADEVTAVAELCAAMVSVDAGATIGDSLGKYKLIAKLGEGSFGEVWNALDEELDRYVALKLLRIGIGGVGGIGAAAGGLSIVGRGGLRRVMAEAQAAASLDHPNVVRIHAAGRLPDGRAFIDAQLAGDAAPTPSDPRAVAVGVPLDKVARTENAGSPTENPGFAHRDPRWAARIMEQVVRGVAAAHARGVVHRDIKPANIILTPSGRPMLADFGLSALVATPDSLGSATGVRSGTAVLAATVTKVGVTGTPAFMSPEQARGERATPASDIYSLGATLRYLLLGELPLRPSGKHSTHGQTDVIEQLRRGEISPIEGNSHPRAAMLPLTLIRIADLAMSKRPEDRYISAEQMADDLAAWLVGKPTLAGREGAGKSAALWYRRNALIATTTLIAALIIIAGTWRFVTRLATERDRAMMAEAQARQSRDLAEERQTLAEQAADIANGVTAFMQETLAAAQADSGGRTVTLLEAITYADKEIRKKQTTAPTLPLVEAGVRQAIGRTYSTLGEFTEAESNLKRAYDIRLEKLGADDPATLQAQFNLAEMYLFSDELQKARELCEPLLAAATRLFGETGELTVNAMACLGSINVFDGHAKEAEPNLFRVLELRRAESPPDEVRIARAMGRLVSLHKALRQPELAIDRAREALAIYARVLGEDHFTTISIVSDLGANLAQAGKIDEAEPLQRRAYEWFNAKVGPSHINTLTAGYNVAWMLLTQKKAPAESLVLAKPLADTAEAKLGPMHIATLRHRVLEGRALAGTGEFEKALVILEATADAAAKVGKPALSSESTASRTAVECYEKLNKPDEAAKWKERYQRKRRELEGG